MPRITLAYREYSELPREVSRRFGAQLTELDLSHNRFRAFQSLSGLPHLEVRPLTTINGCEDLCGASGRDRGGERARRKAAERTRTKERVLQERKGERWRHTHTQNNERKPSKSNLSLFTRNTEGLAGTGEEKEETFAFSGGSTTVLLCKCDLHLPLHPFSLRVKLNAHVTYYNVHTSPFARSPQSRYFHRRDRGFL
jgi:hypothetical protein